MDFFRFVVSFRLDRPSRLKCELGAPIGLEPRRFDSVDKEVGGAIRRFREWVPRFECRRGGARLACFLDCGVDGPLGESCIVISVFWGLFVPVDHG